jgi:hypothetical protein
VRIASSLRVRQEPAVIGQTSRDQFSQGKRTNSFALGVTDVRGGKIPARSDNGQGCRTVDGCAAE